MGTDAADLRGVAQNRADAIKALLKRGADANITTQASTSRSRRSSIARRASCSARCSRRRCRRASSRPPARCRPRCRPRASCSRPARCRRPSGSGRGAGGRSGRGGAAAVAQRRCDRGEARCDGAGRSATRRRDDLNARAPPRDRGKGGMTALHHAARRATSSGAALLEGGADINQKTGDGNSPLLDGGDQRPVRPGDDARRARRQPELADERQRRHAAVGGGQHAVAAAHALPAAAGDGAAEGHLPRRDEGAARSRRRSERAHERRIPGIMVYSGCGNRNCGLAERPDRRRSGARRTARTSTR